ncbi:MAG: KpsF/GutQ family sugar-phosphate isomerase [Ostreibacterium sp.]
MNEKALYQLLNEAVDLQISSLRLMREQIDDNFNHVITQVLACKGRLVISGIGKSGLVGKKMVATLASTGTPSFFLHPTEAFHGDLGMMRTEDIIVLISNSGETDDVIKLIPSLKKFGNKIIAMTGNLESTLATHADYTLNIGIEREMCPHNLAPTTSTLVTSAMGDLLAIVLMTARGFKPEDFAQFHPGGNLGKRLLSTASDLMDKAVPMVSKDTLISDCLLVLSHGRKGVCLVMDDAELQGIITDGDIRRAVASLGREETLLDKKAEELMSENPHCIDSSASWGEVEDYIREHKVKPLVVLENAKVVGLIGLLNAS